MATHNPAVVTQNSPPANSRAHSAYLARLIGRWMQLGFVVGLFVLWRVAKMDFWNAFELCLVGGVLVYSGLNIYAAMVVAWTGPVMAARLSRLVGVILYVLMRYVYHDSFWRALFVWMALGIVSWYLVARARRRAVAASPVAINSAS